MEEESFFIIIMYLVVLYLGVEKKMFKELMCFYYIIIEIYFNIKIFDLGVRMMNLIFIGRDIFLVIF